MIFKVTGGARIDKANATWPFASLIVDSDKLILATQVLGYFVFHPSEIVSIQPVLGGIKIIHMVSGYKNDIVFLTTKNALKLISEIQATGFFNGVSRDEKSLNEIKAIREKKKGFPIKRSIGIGFIVLWNLLFILDFVKYFLNDHKGMPLSYGAISALGLTLISLFLTVLSKDFRKLILADGWELKDIIKFIVFVMIIGGFMLISIILLNLFLV